MDIYLMQHGSCLSKEIDPAMPLSPVGRDQILRSAEAARAMGLRFGRIVCSPKLRAVQTAEMMAGAMGYPPDGITTSEAFKAMAPPAEGERFLRALNADSVFVAGHLPNLADLAAFILYGDTRLRLHVENGGLTCIRLPQGSAEAPLLKWHLSPMQLQVIAGS
ncbi:SixA phosphatase family protein [Desulfocurvus sp. DL9XJH121]